MKDPAVLFYTADFLTGTFTMTDEQVGKYIRLLCLQHQKGLLCEKDMINICKSYDKDIYDKFTIDTAGNYYNARMKLESDKRKNYSDSRRGNRLGKVTADKKEESKTIISKSYDNHMENINENINVIASDNSISKSALFFENLDLLEEELSASEEWLGHVASKYNLSLDRIRELVKLFCQDLKGKDDTGRHLKEYKSYFFNWVKKNKEPDPPHKFSTPYDYMPIN